jgi:hypothetical protein
VLSSRRERAAVPSWLARLGLGIAALGIATGATVARGIGWSISAICFALIAIVLIVTVLAEQLRRR